MDNKLFNINGDTLYQFKLALQLLLFEQEGELDFDVNSKWGRIGTIVSGYKFTKEKGLILYWHINDKQISKGVKSIKELIDVDNSDPKLTKSLRKYKLALLNDDIKKRVGIPFDLLLHSLWNWYQKFKGWSDMVYEDWEVDLDHDGSNGKGFRIYTEGWGRIDGPTTHTSEDYSCGAIKPVYLWFGR